MINKLEKLADLSDVNNILQSINDVNLYDYKTSKLVVEFKWNTNKIDWHPFVFLEKEKK